MEDLKLGVLMTVELERTGGLLVKEDVIRLLKIAGVKLPGKVAFYRCQGYAIQIEQERQSKAKLWIWNANESYKYEKSITQESFSFEQKNILGKEEKVCFKVNQHRAELNFNFFDKEGMQINVLAYIPFVSVMKGKEYLNELKEKQGDSKQIAIYLKKKVQKKYSNSDVQIFIQKKEKDEIIEQVEYVGDSLQKLEQKVILDEKEQNYKKYCISNRYYSIKHIKIIYKENLNLIYYVREMDDTVCFKVKLSSKTKELFKELKEMDKNKFSEFRISQNDEMLKVRIKRPYLTDGLEEFLKSEEDAAMKLFNSKKISL